MQQDTNSPAEADDNIIAKAIITPSKDGLQIPPGFIGLSHEWGTAQSMMGTPEALNQSYLQLLRNITAFGNGPFILRIGGNSADKTGEATPQTAAPFAAVYRVIGARFILGLNLGKDDPELALEQARAYAAAMPRKAIIGFEIGNEPDLFYRNGHRPHSYTITDYFSDFSLFRQKLMSDPETKNVKVIGPAWAILSNLRHLPEFLEQEKPYLAMITQHWYPNNVCGGKPAPPPAYQLSEPPAESGPRAVKPWVPIVKQAGLTMRMGEMNSFACGGARGVSDRFVAALWAIDAMYRLAKAGMCGVNFHSGNGGNYAAFAFRRQGEGSASQTIPEVRPLYYGLLFFAEATASHSHLLPVDVQTDHNIKIYATEDRRGVVRITALNKETDLDGQISIQINGNKKEEKGSLIRLLAPEYAAANGITIAGQTFDGSNDGKPVGNKKTEEVKPQDNVYTFRIPAASAALLTINKR
jgi:hypothetical protein